MIYFEYLEEVYGSLKQHKTRNILTGFGIAWGVFVVIVLLGAGEGLQENVLKIFSGYAENSMWIYGGQTSAVYKGEAEGKLILFDNELLTKIKSRFREVKEISPEITLSRNIIISHEKENYSAQIKGVWEDYFKIKLLKIEDGRAFNPLDKERMVCIIGSKIKEVLFKDREAIGSFILISGGWYRVVGVLSKGTLFNQNEERSVFITTINFRASFLQGNDYYMFGIATKKDINYSAFEKKLKLYLSNKIGFAESDNKALFIINSKDQVEAFNNLFTGIKIFLWCVGFCMVLTGVIGVANMMLVIVKERTKEIGIRRAIGAKSRRILGMILSESIAITVISGLFGMILGIGIINVANIFLASMADIDNKLLSSLKFNLPIALFTLLMLVISGVVAGIIPAKNATEINPVDALNSDTV